MSLCIVVSVGSPAKYREAKVYINAFLVVRLGVQALVVVHVWGRGRESLAGSLDGSSKETNKHVMLIYDAS